MADKSMSVMERGLESGSESWDPFREFRALSPFGGLFEDIFAPMRASLPSVPKGWLPRVDVQETEKEYVLTASLAGVRKEDVKVDVKDDILTITGEKKSEKEEKGKTWLRRENCYGSFQRSFAVPDGIHPEDVHASIKDGVLTVTLRKPAQAKSRSVDIKID